MCRISVLPIIFQKPYSGLRLILGQLPTKDDWTVILGEWFEMDAYMLQLRETFFKNYLRLNLEYFFFGDVNNKA